MGGLVIDFRQMDARLAAESLERLRVVSHMSEESWLDLLRLNWWDYTLVRTGRKQLAENSILRLSDYFRCNPRSLLRGDVDFHALQVKSEANSWKMPEQYSFAAYGRRRTTITTFEYLEKYHGWRLRYDVLRHLNLSESVLIDPFAPISMRIITDALTYLEQRHFCGKDFFAMGMYSHAGNEDTILGQFYSQLLSPKEIIEHMWGDCLKFYEKNCVYQFLKLDNEGALLEVTSEPQVAEEMKIMHLGSEHVCSLKAGMMASAPMYLGLLPATVVEKTCVHKGASSCLFEISFNCH